MENFFRNNDERNLWIRLNAERIRYSEKNNNNLGSINKKFSYLWISNNQLIYDEYENDEPRFSLAELSGLNHDKLLELANERNDETMEKIFGNFSKINEDYL